MACCMLWIFTLTNVETCPHHYGEDTGEKISRTIFGKYFCIQESVCDVWYRPVLFGI